MKWFKHISDSIDDPFISELIDQFGSAGYYVFFGVLEVYSREFKTKNDWKLSVTMSYLCRKLYGTRKQKLLKVIYFIHRAGKWSVEVSGDRVIIYIRKFRDYLDETTLKKLRLAEKNSGTIPETFRNESGTLPKNVATDVDVDVDVENYLAKAAPSAPSPSRHFSEKVGKYLDEINAICKAISETPKGELMKRGLKNPWSLVQGCVNNGYHPQAILDALNALINSWDAVEYPQKFCEKIALTKSGNYHEREHVEQSKQFSENWNASPEILELVRKVGRIPN